MRTFREDLCGVKGDPSGPVKVKIALGSYKEALFQRTSKAKDKRRGATQLNRKEKEYREWNQLTVL